MSRLTLCMIGIIKTAGCCDVKIYLGTSGDWLKITHKTVLLGHLGAIWRNSKINWIGLPLQVHCEERKSKQTPLAVHPDFI